MIQREGYELILGSTMDEQFGPLLLFGTGGEMVEVFKDRAVALPPLNTTLARRMMEQTDIFKALTGIRGRKPVDLAALEQLLVRFSQMVIDQRSIKEIDINPLLASPEQFLALDARIILHDAQTQEQDLPKLAIRPYPAQYVSSCATTDGQRVTLRPIRPDDEPMMIQFHRTLSEQSVHLRYFGALSLDQRTAHERLTRMCFVDYDRQIALVAVPFNAQGAPSEIVAVGRLIRLHGTRDAEVAILVSDPFQGKGLGTEIVRQLLNIARQEGLQRIFAEMLPENRVMQQVFRDLGFEVRHKATEQTAEAELVLSGGSLAQ